MSRFQFVVDEQAEEYMNRIVQKMMEYFSISEEEAVGRVNRHFRGLEITGPIDLVYHELPDFWAQRIYYVPGTHWWVPGEPLKIDPFP